MLNNLAVVSTADAAPGERLGLWGDFVGRHIGPLRADTFGDPQFSGRLELGNSSGVSVARIVVSRHRVQRTPGLIRKDSRDYVKLVAQVEGAACFEQNGRKVVLAPGEWSLYDMTRPYAVSNSEPINQIIMMFAYQDLNDRQIRRDALFKDTAFLAYLAKVRPYLRDQEVRLLAPSACNPPIGDTVFTR